MRNADEDSPCGRLGLLVGLGTFKLEIWPTIAVVWDLILNADS